MKKLITIRLLLLVIISLECSGCSVSSSKIWKAYSGHSIGTSPLMIPGLYLVDKNIKEINAIMEAEEKADLEFENLKNPVYYITLSEEKTDLFRKNITQ